MVIRLSLLAITLLLLPVMALGQSYEWSDRHTEQTLRTVSGQKSQVGASEHGIYSVGIICNWACTGILSKFRAADGKLLWRRKLVFEGQQDQDISAAHSVAVNDLGVFVVGVYLDRVGPQSFTCVSFVRRYSHDGDIVWTVLDNDSCARVIDSDADGLYVVGSAGPGIAELRHLSFAGELLWSRVLPLGTYNAWSVVVGDGQVFIAPSDLFIYVYRTNGDSLGHFSRHSNSELSQGQMVYHAGFLYLASEVGITKYSADGDVIWNFDSSQIPTEVGVLDFFRAVIAVSGNSLVVASTVSGIDSAPPRALALVRIDFNGSLLDVTPYWAHQMRIQFSYLSALDGALYVAGSADRHRGRGHSLLTGRLSEKDLIRPAILALQGAAPAQPPRLAVLHHDYGAGPVRVSIRDAAPGSFQWMVGFDEDLTPVAYEKVADMNGNGYEELVVVSRLPAVAEVRDSLDGSLLSRIKLGERFEPIAADVEERPGTAPRLAVVVRNTSTEHLLVRVHNLASGTLLDSLAYNPNFDPVDVLALPASGAGRRYAVLSRNPLAGSPHKIEIRGTSSALVENYWMNSVNEPLELALTGTAADPVLAALMNQADSQRPGIRQADLQSASASTLDYTDQFRPAAMAVLPDSDGNGYPQLTVLSDKADGKVKTETRDAQTGALDQRINFNPDYRPQDVAYVGAVPGFSTSALAVIGLPKEVGEGGDDAPIRAEIVDVDGSKLFDLNFRFRIPLVP